MIKLQLGWREVLWWMQGGMADIHIGRSVYEDMVNKVWTQCTEQERCNIHNTLVRDVGMHWRNFDETSFEYLKQVLARFNPENQYAVTMKCKSSEDYQSFVRLAIFPAVCIVRPYNLPKGDQWTSDKFEITIRTYKWQGEYRFDWNRSCTKTSIVKIKKMTIPDNGI